MPVLSSLSRGPGEYTAVLEGFSHGFKRNSREAKEQCLRQLKPEGPRTGWRVMKLNGIFAVSSHRMKAFCSPHHTSMKGHIVLQTAEVLKLGFLRMQQCVCLCSALISKRQTQVKIYPQLSHSWQQFPTWISGGLSWLRMLLNHLHYGRALVVFSPH